MSQPIDVSLSPEEILAEVRKFIPESVKQCQRTNCHEVTVGALVLLRNLPAAREAVLEYLSKVFFVAVNRQIRHVEVRIYLQILNIDKHLNIFLNINKIIYFLQMHPNSPLVDESIMNVTVPQIHKALIEIVSCNSQAWAPLVASWSLDLLGIYLSCKLIIKKKIQIGN